MFRKQNIFFLRNEFQKFPKSKNAKFHPFLPKPNPTQPYSYSFLLFSISLPYFFFPAKTATSAVGCVILSLVQVTRTIRFDSGVYFGIISGVFVFICITFVITLKFSVRVKWKNEKFANESGVRVAWNNKIKKGNFNSFLLFKQKKKYVNCQNSQLWIRLKNISNRWSLRNLQICLEPILEIFVYISFVCR